MSLTPAVISPKSQSPTENVIEIVSYDGEATRHDLYRALSSMQGDPIENGTLIAENINPDQDYTDDTHNPAVSNFYSLVSYAQDYEQETLAYITRVENDGGTVTDPGWVDQQIAKLKEDQIYNDLSLFLDVRGGIKTREDGGTTYVEKWYDMSQFENDFVQTTEASQPQLETQGIFANGNVYMTAPSSDSLNLLEQPEDELAHRASILIWGKINGFTQTAEQFIGKSGEDHWMFRRRANISGIEAKWRNNGSDQHGGSNYTETVAFDDNEWHQGWARWARGGGFDNISEVGVDNTADVISTTTTGVGMSPSAGDVTLFVQDAGGLQRYYGGQLNTIMLFSNVITESYIADHYNDNLGYYGLI